MEKKIRMAYQNQYDVLDTYGQSKEAGKQVNNDIHQNKKKFPYLKALEVVALKSTNGISSLYASDSQGSNNEKITAVKEIFNISVIKECALQVNDSCLSLILFHLKEVSPSN